MFIFPDKSKFKEEEYLLFVCHDNDLNITRATLSLRSNKCEIGKNYILLDCQ